MNRFILIPVLLVGVLTALTYDDYDLEIGVLSVSIFLLFFIFFHLDKFKKKQEEAKAKELAEVIKRRHKKEATRVKKEEAGVKQEKARVKKEEARTKKEEERSKTAEKLRLKEERAKQVAKQELIKAKKEIERTRKEKARKDQIEKLRLKEEREKIEIEKKYGSEMLKLFDQKEIGIGMPFQLVEKIKGTAYDRKRQVTKDSVKEDYKYGRRQNRQGNWSYDLEVKYEDNLVISFRDL